MDHKMKRHRHLPAVFALALAGGLSAPALVSAGAPDADQTTLSRLEVQAGVLGAQIAAMGTALDGLVPAPRAAEPARIEMAQSQDVAQLSVRLQALEEQLRTMTGQMEGLTFQMTQLQTLVERMQEDTDFRFQALEGGAGGKTEAATQPGGVMPSGELPQSQAPAASEGPVQDLPPGDMPMDGAGPDTLGAPMHGEAVPPTGPAQPFEIPANAEPLLTQGDLDQQLPAPVALGADGLPQSRDPALNGGVPQPLGTLSETDLANLGTGRPLDLSYDPGNVVNDADADAQYAAGFDAVARGDYQFAQDQFSQFIALYPNHPNAPDATNWLGEALLQNGSYDEAADVLLTGFQNYPESPRAPDMLFKLGIALAGAGETDTACRTFGEVAKRYPQVPPAFAERLTQERSKAGCA